MARSLLSRIDAAGRWVIVCRSLGGVIALALATGWFGVTPSRVFGVGIKVAWSDDELRRLAMLAAQPAKRFASCAAIASITPSMLPTKDKASKYRSPDSPF